MQGKFLLLILALAAGWLIYGELYTTKYKYISNIAKGVSGA